jgi:competence protein ComEC
MVGFTPSITRAGIMVLLMLLARYSGRKISVWRIIIIVAAITLFINPANLTNQGWLLSFASYAGVMIISPRLQRFLYGKKKPGFVGSSLITSFSATFMTLPIVLYYYGQISLLFFISNLIIMPTLPYVMGSTFLCGIFAGIPIIESIISFITTKMLGFHVWIIGCLGEMKEFLVEVKIGIPAVLLIYVAIALIIGINYFIIKTRSDIIKT